MTIAIKVFSQSLPANTSRAVSAGRIRGGYLLGVAIDEALLSDESLKMVHALEFDMSDSRGVAPMLMQQVRRVPAHSAAKGLGFSKTVADKAVEICGDQSGDCMEPFRPYFTPPYADIEDEINQIAWVHGLHVIARDGTVVQISDVASAGAKAFVGPRYARDQARRWLPVFQKMQARGF